MVLKTKNLLMASAGVALAFGFSSCKKDKDDSQTDKLVGEWEVQTIDGYNIPSAYLFTFEFQEDQDFKFCYEEVGVYSYCYDGDWEWGNDNKTEIDIVVDGEDAVFQIETLTDDVLEGDLIDEDGYETNYTLEKIN